MNELSRKTIWNWKAFGGERRDKERERDRPSGRHANIPTVQKTDLKECLDSGDDSDNHHDEFKIKRKAKYSMELWARSCNQLWNGFPFFSRTKKGFN